ncbi:MAG: phosphodiester glycosidase family protein [Candidatus Gastranaerophilales bacterium]|nr:phosphodiester glycosidase family protein [Candidatus Gastranaerophilales bacterium]
MYYLACRSEKFFLTFISFLMLYSITYSVIAQDKAKDIDISPYKFKLALADIPKTFNLTPPIITTNSDTIKYNNEQASLRISSEKNLLVSFLRNDIKNSATNQNMRIFPAISSVSGLDTLTYYIPQVKTSITDKKKWDDAIKNKYRDGLIRSLAPGVKHIAIKKYTKSGPMFINVVEINPQINPNISIEPVLSGSGLSGTGKVSTMVAQSNAIAGINASFFKQSTGTPLGTLIINQELLTGPIFDRVTLGIGNGNFKMARISLQGSINTSDGREIKIDNVNQPRMLSSYTLIYSSKWGKLAPPSPQYGIQVAINNGKVTKISKNRLNIVENGFVIVGPEKQLGKLKVNDEVKIKFTTNPNWTGIKHAISGGPYLIKEGQIFIDVKDQKLQSIGGRNPRTAVGYTQDNKFMMVTVDGRQKGSVGATLTELAGIMKKFGCINAMNLDGGSSTQMIVQNRIVNNPLNRGGSYVANGLIVKVNENE